MDTDLIARLWAQALHEGEGVSGVGQRMAQLVAEECAKVADETTEYGALDMGGETKAYATSCAIRERFGLPTN